MALRQDGTRKQRNGWEYNDSEGGYYKQVGAASVYILEDSKRTWVLDITTHTGHQMRDYVDSLRNAKLLAEGYLNA